MSNCKNVNEQKFSRRYFHMLRIEIKKALRTINHLRKIEKSQ